MRNCYVVLKMSFQLQGLSFQIRTVLVQPHNGMVMQCLTGPIQTAAEGDAFAWHFKQYCALDVTSY